jgi:hypothetical protein
MLTRVGVGAVGNMEILHMFLNFDKNSKIFA